MKFNAQEVWIFAMGGIFGGILGLSLGSGKEDQNAIARGLIEMIAQEVTAYDEEQR